MRWKSVARVSLALGLLAVGTAVAADDPIARIKDLEWHRGSAAEVAALLTEDASPATRQAAVVALGRLRSADALEPLLALRDDPDPTVRVAVAEALGYTPGAAPAIRDWIDAESVNARWAQLAKAPDDVLPPLLLSLGRQGDATDVDRLVGALVHPWPSGAAAAESLGRLGRREIKGLERALPALLAGLSRPDPRTVDAMAYAIRRIGLAGATATQVRTLQDGWMDVPGGPARASLVRAVWPRLAEADRKVLLRRALADADPVVRVAALDSIGPGEVPVSLVAGLLTSSSPWERSAATAAVGRIGGAEAQKILAIHAESRAGWDAAEAWTALAAAGGALDPSVAKDPSRPVAVRAAVAGALSDVPSLVDLTRDDSALVRSAAAQAMLGVASRVPAAEILNMLESTDIVVRQVAVELILRRETEPGAVPLDIVRPLIGQLRVDTDPDVLASGFALLRARAKRRPKDFDPKDKLLADTIVRGLGHPDAYVRDAAAGLRDALELDLQALARRDDLAIPDLRQVDRIASARVLTERGEFRIDLRPDAAPLAVANFARLADKDFFDGVVWHRVVPAFVVQGGDPRSDGSGGPGWTIPDEVSSLPYATGAVGMARSGPDTGGSQWFVTLSPQPHLVGDYTLFGYVTGGMHVVNRLQRGDRVLDVIIERVDIPAVATP